MQRFRSVVLGCPPPPIRVGRYVLGDLAGVGGMALVFAAHDPVLDRSVAVKLLRGGSSSREHELRAECRTVAALDHPNVVRVYDVGRYDAPDLEGLDLVGVDSLPPRGLFMVMERLRGSTLSSWAHGRSASEIVPVVIAAGRGIAAAHAAGVVHRDLKPSNIWVTDAGTAKVLDFGVAVALQTTHDSATTETLPAVGVAGTPGFMAPEQQTGETPGPLCDQFSLCATALVTLGGREAWDILRMTPRVRGPWERGLASLPRPTGLRRGALRALRRGLSLEPHERFPDIDALLRALTPRGGRKSIFAAVGLGGCLTLLATAGDPVATNRCDELSDRAQRVFGEDRQRRVTAAMQRTQLPYASATARTVESATAQSRHDWWSTHHAVCGSAQVAVSVAGTRQLACLDARLLVMDSLLRSLETVTADTLPAVGIALGRLPTGERCGAATTWPLDRTAGVSRSLLESYYAAKGLFNAGREQLAAEGFAEVAAEADARGWNALGSAAKVDAARALVELGDLATAEALVFELVFADDGGLRVSRVAALVEMAYIERARGRWDDAAAHLEQARAAIGSDGLPPQLESRLLQTEADLANAIGRYDTAKRNYQQLLDRRWGDEVALQSNLASVLFAQGHNVEALALYESAYAQAREQYGATHPRVGQLVGNLANAYVKVGEIDRGIAAARRAASVAHEGRNALVEGRAINNLAGLLIEVGEPQEALTVIDRALRSDPAEPPTDGFGPVTAAALTLNLQLARAAAGQWAALERDLSATRASVDALGADHPFRASLRTIDAEAALHRGDASALTLAHEAFSLVTLTTDDPSAIGDACELVARAEATVREIEPATQGWRTAAIAHYANAGALGAMRLEQRGLINPGAGHEPPAPHRETLSTR